MVQRKRISLKGLICCTAHKHKDTTTARRSALLSGTLEE
jgi:hypothetical protein